MRILPSLMGEIRSIYCFFSFLSTELITNIGRLEDFHLSLS